MCSRHRISMTLVHRHVTSIDSEVTDEDLEMLDTTRKNIAPTSSRCAVPSLRKGVRHPRTSRLAWRSLENVQPSSTSTST